MRNYIIISDVRSQLLQMMRQIEYLAQSILEIRDTGAERDDESFGMAYKELKLQERKVLSLMKNYQDLMKELVEKHAGESAKDKQLMGAVNLGYLEFLKRHLPVIKDIQLRVTRLEMEAVSDVYCFLHLLRWEVQTHAAFSEAYKKIFHDVLQAIKKELMDVYVTRVDVLTWHTLKA